MQAFTMEAGLLAQQLQALNRLNEAILQQTAASMAADRKRALQGGLSIVLNEKMWHLYIHTRGRNFADYSAANQERSDIVKALGRFLQGQESVALHDSDPYRSRLVADVMSELTGVRVAAVEESAGIKLRLH